MQKAYEEAFAQDIKHREQSLIRKLHTCKEDNLSTPNYLKPFKGIRDEIAIIEKPFFDDDKVSWLANGFGLRYMNFVDSQLYKPPNPTFSQFVSALK